MIRHYTDDELIDGLHNRKTTIISYLYQEYSPVLRHHLLQNSGTFHDAEDLFQDTLILIYKRCRNENLQLACSFKTYFVSVAKNLWFQRLDVKYRLLYEANCEVHDHRAVYRPEDDEEREFTNEMERIFYKNMELLPFDCRQLLQLYCLRVPIKEIARMMNYKDENYVKTRKYLCKKILRRRVMSDPEWRLIL